MVVPGQSGLEGRRKTGHANKLVTISHHDNLAPLDAMSAPKEELLQYMNIHDARLLKQSLAAQKSEMASRFGPDGLGGHGVMHVPFNIGGHEDVVIPKLHIRKGNEAQYAGIGFGVDSARNRAPVFGKKRHATVDNNLGNCLAGCFIIGGPVPTPLKTGGATTTSSSVTAAKITTPRDLPPIENAPHNHNNPSPRRSEAGDATFIDGEGGAALESPPFASSRRHTEVRNSRIVSVHVPHPPGGSSPPRDDLNSPSTLKKNPMMKALMEPRKFRSDSGIFGEVEAPATQRVQARGKSRQFTDSYWGNM